MKCPTCGSNVSIARLARFAPWEQSAERHGFERHEWAAFGAGAADAVALGATYERKKPAREAKLESDFYVPAYQSLFSGFVGFIVVGCGAALARQGWYSFLWGGIAGAGCIGVAWFVLLNRSQEAQWIFETITGRDWNNDSYIGKPPVQEPVQVEVYEREDNGNARRVRYANLPKSINDHDLQKVAAKIRHGANFSRRGLKGALSETKYNAIVDPMLDGGMLYYVNGVDNSDGVGLTAAGRAFLKQYEVVNG